MNPHVRITPKKIIVTTAVSLLILLVIFDLLQTRSPGRKISFLPTPTPLASNWKQYVDTSSHYDLSYPPDWKTTPQTADSRQTNIMFTDNGSNYSFSIGIGNTLPDAALIGATTQKQDVVYGGKKFLKIVWNRDGVPIDVAAVPNEVGFHFYAFTMDIPPSDPQKYLAMFDQIMSHLTINRSLDDIISPAVNP